MRHLHYRATDETTLCRLSRTNRPTVHYSKARRSTDCPDCRRRYRQDLRVLRERSQTAANLARILHRLAVAHEAWTAETPA